MANPAGAAAASPSQAPASPAKTPVTRRMGWMRFTAISS